MKILLKSSVSMLVLLGAMVTFSPSQAGNGHGVEKDPDLDKKGKIQLKKSSKKPKKTYPNFQEIAEGKGSETNEYKDIFNQLGTLTISHKLNEKGIKKTPLKNDLLAKVLFHRGIGSKMTKNTALVCKEWHELIASEKNLFRNSLQNPKTGLNFLNSFLLHPSAFIVAQKVLATEFPHQMIYQKFFIDPETQKSLPLVTYEVPQSIVNYASLVQNPAYHPTLCNQFICLDPLDFKTVGLAAYIIEKSPSLQKLLQNALEENPFEFTNFSKLIKNEKNFPSIQKHLMALKLLTLSDDPLAKTEMDKFTIDLSNFLNSIRGCGLEKHIKKYPTFINDPLWSAYTIDILFTDLDATAPLSLENAPVSLQFYNLYGLMNTRHGSSLDSGQIKLFFDYIGAVRPDFSKNLAGCYNMLDVLNYSKEGHYQVSPQLLVNLEGQYETAIQASDYQAVWSVAVGYAGAKQYGKALQILEDALKKIGDIPFRFQILYDIACFILESNDMTSLSKAEEYLLIVGQEFERTQEELLDTTYVYTIGEGDAKKSVELFDCLDLYQLLELKVSFDIAKGDFDQAYNCIKQCDLTSNTDLDSKALKIAIQRQLPHMPQKLKKLLAKELTRGYSKDHLQNPFMLNELNEFQSVYSELLENSKNKSAYKKAMKDNQKRVTQQQSQIEKAPFEETEESSEEILSISKKKDKKTKKDKR